MTSLPKLNDSLLDERMALLEKARTWSPRVTSKLDMHIRTADDYALFRINALDFAAAKNIAEPEAIDLFLHASKLGLFEMNWHLVCPTCGTVVESFKELGGLQSRFLCPLCSRDALWHRRLQGRHLGKARAENRHPQRPL